MGWRLKLLSPTMHTPSSIEETMEAQVIQLQPSTRLSVLGIYTVDEQRNLRDRLSVAVRAREIEVCSPVTCCIL